MGGAGAKPGRWAVQGEQLVEGRRKERAARGVHLELQNMDLSQRFLVKREILSMTQAHLPISLVPSLLPQKAKEIILKHMGHTQ